MPGHIKKSDGPDPCPDQWLLVSDELKVKLKSKPYDPKKSYWVPDKATGGYWEGLLESVDGEKASVKILESGDVSIFLTFLHSVHRRAQITKIFKLYFELLTVIRFNLCTNYVFSFCRSKFSKWPNFSKSIHPSLTVLMTWLV